MIQNYYAEHVFFSLKAQAYEIEFFLYKLYEWDIQSLSKTEYNDCGENFAGKISDTQPVFLCVQEIMKPQLTADLNHIHERRQTP